MPILNPGSNDPKPKDWRYAYDELNKLKALVRKYNISTDRWRIEFPTGVQKAMDKRWKLYLLYPGTPVGDLAISMVYVGHDGRTAAEAIRGIYKVYQDYLRSRPDANRPQPRTPVDKTQNAEFVQRAKQKWIEKISDPKYRSLKGWKIFELEYPNLNAFMKQKAGMLDMTMEEYLMRHPMSHRYPTPPLTEQQYQNRLREMEQHAQHIEQAKKDNPNLQLPPGW